MQKKITIYNKTKNAVVSDNVKPAFDFISRLCGLIPYKTLADGGGLFIKPCSQIHTFFMKFPIDAVFIDKNGKVLRMVKNLRPYRLSPWIIGANAVLEFNANFAEGKITAGDVLEFRQ